MAEKIADKTIGRTRDGLNTNLRTIMGGLENPVTFLLFAGNDHYSIYAINLLKTFDFAGNNVLADRAYGIQAIRDYISEYGTRCTTHLQSNISNPWPVDWDLHKERHLIECFFQKLKRFRRTFTRYDKLDVSFFAFVHLDTIAILLI